MIFFIEKQESGINSKKWDFSLESSSVDTFTVSERDFFDFGLNVFFLKVNSL